MAAPEAVFAEEAVKLEGRQAPPSPRAVAFSRPVYSNPLAVE